MNQNINASNSTINIVSGDQYNSQVYSSVSLASLSNEPPIQAPFNDAPIDFLSIHFTGRKKELELIARAFNQLRGNIPLRCALFGDQGVGKSQLTYEWARFTYDQGQNSYILWISATTIEKLYQGFCKLLHLVNHPDRSHPEQNARLIAARRWFEEVDTGNWLLVLDNVFPETMDFLRQHLPRQNGRGSILFTTRTEHVAVALASTAGERHEVLEVPLLDVQGGVELFFGLFNASEVDAPSAKVEEIIKSVGCLPLAISHATAYIKQSRSTVDGMLELYQSKHKIDLVSWENSLSDYEHKSVAATFTCQLQDLEQQCPDVNNLLSVLAFFDPESIPLEMLIAGAKIIAGSQQLALHNPALPQSSQSFVQPQPNIPDTSPMLPLTSESLLALVLSPVRLRNALTQLRNRCLTAYQNNSQPSTLRIHDLIRLVILDNTKRRSSNQELFEFAVEIACNAFKQIENHHLPEWWPQCELLVPHIQSLASQQELSTKAKMQLLLASCHHARYLEGRGRHAEAEKLYERVVGEWGHFGLEDLDKFIVMHDLAVVYETRGRYNDAKILLEQVLQSRMKQLGPEHRETLTTTYQLARVYDRLGRYDDAEALLSRDWRHLEDQLGPKDRVRFRMMFELGRVYHSQRRYCDSEALFKQVLLVAEEHIGLEHIDTLAVMHHLATVYESQKRHHDAKILLQKVLVAREKWLGSEHLDTLATKHELAKVYCSQECYEDAASLFQQVRLAMERNSGPKHQCPFTLLTKYNLARVYHLQGQYDEAEALLVYVSACQEKVLGQSHPSTQDTVLLLVSVYEKLGRFNDAMALKQPARPLSH